MSSKSSNYNKTDKHDHVYNKHHDEKEDTKLKINMQL